MTQQTNILEASIAKLKMPFEKSNRTLIIIYNISIIISMIIYIVVNKIVNGHFFVTYVYFLAFMFPHFLVNMLSLIYNYLAYQEIIKGIRILDHLSIFFSMIGYLVMIVVNLTGYKLTGIDVMITNFALSYTMMYFALFTIWRLGSILWYLIIIVSLVASVHRLGSDYEYHFLTNQEVKEYKKKLEAGDPTSLAREKIIYQEGKKKVNYIRYVSVWIIFQTFGLIVALNYTHLYKRIQKLLPQVIGDIDTARRKHIEEQTNLKKEIEFKQRELTNHTMDAIEKNMLLKEVKEALEEVSRKIEPVNSEILKPVLKKIGNISKHNQSKEFRKIFDSAHPGFLEKLSETYPSLTNTDLQHCAYLKMDLNNEQIANLLHVEIKTLRHYRYRIKQKMGLQDIEVKEFIQGF